MRLRSRPPQITQMWQPNSYTKPLFEAVGRKDKSEYFSKADAHAVLATYIANHLSAGAATAAAAAAAAARPTAGRMISTTRRRRAASPGS